VKNQHAIRSAPADPKILLIN